MAKKTANTLMLVLLALLAVGGRAQEQDESVGAAASGAGTRTLPAHSTAARSLAPVHAYKSLPPSRMHITATCLQRYPHPHSHSLERNQSPGREGRAALPHGQ